MCRGLMCSVCECVRERERKRERERERETETSSCTSLKLTALRMEDKFLALSILATKM